VHAPENSVSFAMLIEGNVSSGNELSVDAQFSIYGTTRTWGDNSRSARGAMVSHLHGIACRHNGEWVEIVRLRWAQEGRKGVARALQGDRVPPLARLS
jgi:hypothetical protein